jgi:hypothetical protein
MSVRQANTSLDGKLKLHTKIRSIHSAWPSLKQADFPSIDAVMPVPRHPTQAYFFKGTECVQVELRTGATIFPSSHLSEGL